jgi:hypothetical protein
MYEVVSNEIGTSVTIMNIGNNAPICFHNFSSRFSMKANTLAPARHVIGIIGKNILTDEAAMKFEKNAPIETSTYSHLNPFVHAINKHNGTDVRTRVNKDTVGSMKYVNGNTSLMVFNSRPHTPQSGMTCSATDRAWTPPRTGSCI